MYTTDAGKKFVPNTSIVNVGIPLSIGYEGFISAVIVGNGLESMAMPVRGALMVGCTGSLLTTVRVPLMVPTVVGAKTTKIKQDWLGSTELAQFPPGASAKPLVTANCAG